MKRYLVILASILIVTALLLGGCSSSPSSITSSSSSITSSTQLSTTTTTSGKVYEFKFTDQFTAQQTNGALDELLGKTISDKTNGRVKFTYYHSESLGKMADFLTMLNNGVVDAACVTPVSYAKQFDMEAGVELPGLMIPSRTAELELYWQLNSKGYFTGLAPYKVLAFQATPPIMMFLNKKIVTLDEIKGLKIRVSSNPMNMLMKQLGATPMAVPFTDVYMNMQTGVLDGLITAPEAVMQAKLYEVTKVAYTDPLAAGALYIIMSKKAWDGIPADLQALVDQAIQDYKSAFLASVKPADDSMAENLSKNGMTVTSLSAAEAAKLKAAAATIKNDWITAHSSSLPGKEMMDYIDNFVANYK